MPKTVQELQAENAALEAKNAELEAAAAQPPPAPVVEVPDPDDPRQILAEVNEVLGQIKDERKGQEEGRQQMEALVAQAQEAQAAQQTGLKPHERKTTGLFRGEIDGGRPQAFMMDVGDDDEPPQALADMLEFKHVGQKTLRGFFNVSPRGAHEQELHKLYDYCVLAGEVMAREKNIPYVQAVKSLQLYKLLIAELGGVDDDLKKALDTATTGEGADWIPTGYSADLIDRVVLQLKVAPLFRAIPMPTDPYRLPTLISGATAYLVGESVTDNAAAITASTSGTSKVELGAVKFGVRQLFSDEVEEDSIIPILDMVRSDCALALAEGEEKALLDGDVTATHMDTDVTAAADVRKSLTGLRKSAAGTGTNVDGSTFAITVLRAVYKAQGKWAADPNRCAWITGTTGFCNLLGLAEVITLDKLGPQATVLTGQLGVIDGRPIVVSEHVRQDLSAAANPVYSGTYTYLLHVFRPGFVIGKRGAAKVEQGRIVETQQTQVVTTMRWDFEEVWDYTANNTVALCYKVS